MRRTSVLLLLALTASACMPPEEAESPPDATARPGPEAVSPDSDARAVEIATAVLERLGGRANWDGTRFVYWKFFGRREHYWDRQTGNVRIHQPEVKASDGRRIPEKLVLMNIRDKTGRAWVDGVEVVDPEDLEKALDEGYSWWVNDSYWMFMPYKLLDPGVTLKYSGERAMEDGRVADVVDLTFDGVGLTPENRYEVFVARDTGLVEQWAFYRRAADSEPAFTLPWADWKRFGDIWLATRHQAPQEAADWDIAVLDSVPRGVFESPEEVPKGG